MIMTWQDVERAGANAKITTAPLAWLLRFAQQNLDELTAGDWMNLSLEIKAFVVGKHLGTIRDRDRALRPVLKQIGYTEGQDQLEPGPLRGEDLPTEREIRALKGGAKHHIDEFVKSDVSTIPVGPKSLRLVRNQVEGWSFVIPQLSSHADRFLWNLGHLLGEEGLRIKVCPACQKYFDATRTNKVYCTTTCQSRTTTRQQRAREKKEKEEEAAAASRAEGKEIG